MTSDLSGNLTLDYTLPTSLALDPNATCPPSTAQVDAALIGCGLAMIDLTTFQPVGAASALVQYAGDPFLPPEPTLKLSASSAAPGRQDQRLRRAGSQDHWYLSTLAGTDRACSGAVGAAPKLTVNIRRLNRSDRNPVPNNGHGDARRLQPPTLTPPKISGSLYGDDQGARKSRGDGDLHRVSSTASR